LGNLLFSYRLYPMIVQSIVAGVDNSIPHLFTLDFLGSVIEEKSYVATGTGSPVAFGVLEDKYRDDFTIEMGLELGLRAVRAATNRDAATGNGYNIATITPTDGCLIMSEEQIEALIKKIGDSKK
ncbi:MAG: proteasome subunit beta, partial [Candidatus Hodarchaeota archaeon]